MTLRTLGYSYRKIYEYMNFETVLAITIGIAIGIITGTMTSRIVVEFCEPNYFKFVNIIQPIHYVAAIIIMILFSVIINIGIYLHMKKIDYLKETKKYE